MSQIGWIEQARKLGADAIYFVEDYPTVLFFKLDNVLEADTQEYEEKIRELYLKVWNTGRVPYFLWLCRLRSGFIALIISLSRMRMSGEQRIAGWEG